MTIQGAIGLWPQGRLKAKKNGSLPMLACGPRAQALGDTKAGFSAELKYPNLPSGRDKLVSVDSVSRDNPSIKRGAASARAAQSLNETTEAYSGVCGRESPIRTVG